MTLREVKAGDVAAVVELERLLFGVDAWNETQVREELTGERRQARVVGDPVVGYAVTFVAGDVVDLQRIAVHPDHQRQGLARLLLDGTVARADRMLLEVSAGNAAALAFYAAAGFVEIDRRRRYYRDGTDAVVMRLPLAAAACGGRG